MQEELKVINLLDQLKLDENGLIPAVVQDYATNEVLMMAYMNKEALEKSIETGMAHYFSRSRQKLWLKGETSGHYQHIKSINIDCDGDTLLLKVEQKDAACHTGHYSCFYRELSNEGLKTTSEAIFDPQKVYASQGGEEAPYQDVDKSRVLQEVYDVIVDRTINPKEGSYTNYLFQKGLDKMLKKVGEEAAEVIIAAKNKSKDEIRYEISDLIYHLLVVMVERGLTLDDIYNELKGRR